MTEVLTLPPNLPNAQNAQVGASKFCPGCGHGMILKSLAFAIDDLNLKEARKILGEDKIIGVSAHNYEEAKIALENGADYLGVGAIFATQWKH